MQILGLTDQMIRQLGQPKRGLAEVPPDGPEVTGQGLKGLFRENLPLLLQGKKPKIDLGEASWLPSS